MVGSVIGLGLHQTKRTIFDSGPDLDRCGRLEHRANSGLACKASFILDAATQIDRRYKRIDGMWLNDSLESTSDTLIAGRSTLKIQYLYEAIETDRSMERFAEASVPCRD